MNILFLVDLFSVVEPMGALQLSAILKKRGHKCYITTVDKGDVFWQVNELKIDCVACSFMSTEGKRFKAVTAALRQQYPHLKIIAGGPHPTYYPAIIDDWELDAIVLGEGDAVIVELIERLFSGGSLPEIPSVHTKEFKNHQACLVEDLDALPFADHSLVADKEPFKYIRMKSFFATRGCPYSCNYCFNSAYNKLYKGKGRILRRRSVGNLIAEIEETKNTYHPDFIRFGDDTFIMRYDDWVEEFAHEYANRIQIPFYFLIHPSFVEEKLISRLKNAGCHSVMMGIESGVASVRQRILNRQVSDEEIKKAFRICRDYDIKVFSNTILAFPDTTFADDLRSLEFTLDCRPFYSGFTVFTPFRGTALGEYVLQKGYVKSSAMSVESFPVSMQSGSVLNTVTDRQREIHRNILVLAPVASLFPLTRNWITKRLIYWKPNVIFTTLGFFVRNYCNMRVWPFKKSFMSFFIIFMKVLRIDRGNYRKVK